MSYKLLVKDRSGAGHIVEAYIGRSMMEIIRDSGAEEILAICGGCCSCSTCHIYVDESDVDRLPAKGRDEADLLDGSDHLEPGSRLSCQIRFTAEMDGVRVTVAPEE